MSSKRLIVGAAVAAAWISNLYLCTAVQTVLFAGPDGYPREQDAKLVENGSALYCEYSNLLKRPPRRAALKCYFDGTRVRTETISCPKNDHRDAFETSYWKNPTLKLYTDIYRKGPFAAFTKGYFFDQAAPPNNTGLDPLRKLNLTIPPAGKEHPTLQEWFDRFVAEKKNRTACAAVLQLVKDTFGTFPELCTEYRQESVEAVQAARDGNWTLQDNKRDFVKMIPPGRESE
ncbi:hypothetical protein FOZ62_022725 [Perkinsus olseni]|uniref:Uncharacterized protein n=1 Tax=Perkinsus olseni TaxID=32597 RepID=A0A7J6QLS2_PEROL|nr:hypothetical protein FOZ62_022725 [Perkinsus olseni]